MAVRDHDRLDRVDVLAQVREVGQDEVDAHHVRRREAQAAVDDDDPPVVLDDGHVLADLPDASEREDAQLAAHPVVAPLSSPWRSSIAWTFAALLVAGLDEREPQPADVVAEHVQRGLDRDRAGRAEQRRVDVLQRRVDLRPGLGLVEHPPHLGAGDVRGDADQPVAAELERAQVVLVVAGEHAQAVDRAQLRAVGLLDGVDPVDLRELREQVRRHVQRRPRRDVVEDHRAPGGRAGDLGEVRDQAAAVRLVVVRRDRQDRLRAGLDDRLGEVRGVARVVGPRAGEDRLLAAELGGDRAHEADVLVVGSCASPRLGGAADDEPVRALLEQVAGERDAGLVVDAAVGAERRDHRREEAADLTHGP